MQLRALLAHASESALALQLVLGHWVLRAAGVQQQLREQDTGRVAAAPTHSVTARPVLLSVDGVVHGSQDEHRQIRETPAPWTVVPGVSLRLSWRIGEGIGPREVAALVLGEVFELDNEMLDIRTGVRQGHVDPRWHLVKDHGEDEQAQLATGA